MFFSNTHWPQLLAPLENISEVYSHSYSHFWALRVIMNMKLSSHGFLFHRNINRRENKAHIPFIIHHNEKKLIIYFWCAAKDNWASQISEVALRKERAVKIPISTIRAIIKSFQSTDNVMNLPGRGRVSISSWCTVRRRVWVAKDHPRTTAGELQLPMKVRFFLIKDQKEADYQRVPVFLAMAVSVHSFK